MRTGKKGKTLGRILAGGLLAAAVFLTAHGSALCVQAGTGSAATKVIRTSSEDEFAQETARLAKKSVGLSVQSNGEVRRYSSGRLIVRVRDGENVDFSRYGASTVIQSTFGVSIVQFSSAASAQKAARSLNALSAVAYVDVDDCTMNTGDTQIREISIDGSSAPDQEIPSGGNVGKPGNLQIGGRTYGQDEDVLFESSVRGNAASTSSTGMSWGVSYIQADKYAAFVKANTSQTVKVAVVDSGVSSHPKMKGRILKGRDFVDNDSNPSDKNGHGTHVAGTIVDCTPGINVKILPVRVMNASGRGNPSTVGNGIRYAVNQGAKVINLSLGGYSHYKYIEECLTYAQSRNVTVVVAAGNECENTKYICPAHMSSPIVVGAINKSGKRAFFSNYGASLDIVAPGVDIKSCWTGGKYATASGTSMAAPHISAAAAMYRLMNPSAGASRIQYLVRCYAKDLGAQGTDNYYGRGVPRMAGAITPSKVTLNKKTTSLQLKKTLTLKASITPSYAGKNKLTWSSSNKGVVTVSGGKLTAKKKGTATITVKTVNGKKATCKVTVTSPVASTASVQVRALQDNIASSFLSKVKEPAAMQTAAATKPSVSSAAAKTGAAATGAGKAASAETASVKTASAETASAETASAKTASAKQEPAAAVSAPEENSAVSENTEPGPGGEAVPAGTADPVKVYIYPAETPDNAPVQDGSIIAGSRLQLAAELVPASRQGEGLVWASSDSSVARIDENGLVTALAEGQATITAVLPTSPGASGDGSGKSSPAEGTAADATEAVRPVAGTGSFVIRVAAPSVLTRHASYEAGSEERQQIEVVLRLPGTIDGSGASDAAQSPAYVLALLRDSEEGKSAVLGALNIGGADSGSIHLHDASGGALLKGIRSPGEAEETLSPGETGGKRATQTGILSVEEMDADGGKADLSLTADMHVLRMSEVADPSGQAGTRAAWECTFAVYTQEDFEALERAAEEADEKSFLGIEAEALCSCRFTLAFDRAGEQADDDAPPAPVEEDEPAAPAEVGKLSVQAEEDRISDRISAPAEDNDSSEPAETGEKERQETAEKQNFSETEHAADAPASQAMTGSTPEASEKEASEKEASVEMESEGGGSF